MSRRALNSLALMAIFAGTLSCLPVSAQERPSRPFPDMSKSRIEMPVKGFLKPFTEVSSGKTNTSTYDQRMQKYLMPARPVAQPKSFAQAKTEAQPKADVQKTPVRVKPAADSKALGSTRVKQQQERVEPGKVHWHKAVQAAMDASLQSGKPVLLFQMMGHLDDRFC